MEILLLVLLYYLSQNPNFAQSVKPLMEQLKNSQQTLNFLNDLSKFNENFQPCKEPKGQNEKQSACDYKEKQESQEKPPKSEHSPTAGIADEFIEQILNGYLHKK